MCIVLLTTAHPDYALIVIDNRDEFILRPTSRPHWWIPSGTPRSASGASTPAAASTPASASTGAPPPLTQPPQSPADDASRPSTAPGHVPSAQLILSSRDLQRPEHGTWLGITRGGNFAVLTNFREDDTHDAAHPIAGQRSRGGMVTAWLAADCAETTEQFVARMLQGPGVKGVGGFSLICGKLRKRHFQTGGDVASPLAVISNRADQVAQVPWIAGRRGDVYGLSNASYDDPDVWPKVRDGKAALLELASGAACADDDDDDDKTAAARAALDDLGNVRDADALRAGLFAILDRDTLPRRPDLSFEQHIPLLKHSIFIPAIGDEAHRADMDRAVAAGPRAALDSADAVDAADKAAADKAAAEAAEAADREAAEELASEERPDPSMGFMTGLYGTQRQTVILVDWNGRVSFTERALWDANGLPIPRGQGDVHFDFQIEGWDDSQ